MGLGNFVNIFINQFRHILVFLFVDINLLSQLLKFFILDFFQTFLSDFQP